MRLRVQSTFDLISFSCKFAQPPSKMAGLPLTLARTFDPHSGAVRVTQRRLTFIACCSALHASMLITDATDPCYPALSLLSGNSPNRCTLIILACGGGARLFAATAVEFSACMGGAP